MLRYLVPILLLITLSSVGIGSTFGQGEDSATGAWGARANQHSAFSADSGAFGHFGSTALPPSSSDAVPGPSVSHWVELVPKPVVSKNISYSGRVTSIAVNGSDSSNLYIGTAQGGVWKSTDGGATWSHLTDNQASLAIGAVTISPDGKTVYAGTGEPNHSGNSYYGAGLLKSSDGGKTWTILGSPSFSNSTISAVVVNRANQKMILVATTSAVCCKGTKTVSNPTGLGAFLTTDGGNTWTLTLSPPGNGGVASMVADPSSANTVYAGDFAGEVWRSTDGGSTWSIILSGSQCCLEARVAVAVSKAYTGFYAAFALNSAQLGFIEQYNAVDGTKFQMKNPPPPSGYSDACGGQCSYNLVMAVDDTNPKLIYFGALDLYQSSDGGKTWKDLTGSVSTHQNQHAIAISPASSSTIFIGNDGGIWRSTNQGLTWSGLNNGLGTLQFESISTGPNGVYLGGTLGNGCVKYDGSNAWTQLLSGDGGWSASNPKNSTILYCVHPGVSFEKSTDGGKTWLLSIAGINAGERSASFAPVAQDPNNASIMYFGGQRIYTSKNNGSTWKDISGLLGNAPITAIQVVPSNSSILYFGDNNGNLRLTYSNSKHTVWGPWPIIDQEKGPVTGIAVNASNPYQLYASFASAGVYKYTRVGVNVTTFWKIFPVPLPKYSANVIRIDPATNFIYVGTDMGVYYSSDGGNTWAQAGIGLPNIAVYDLLVTPTQLLAATDGRGVWTLPLIKSYVTLTLSYSIQGGGSGYAAPTLTYYRGGQQQTTPLQTTPTPYTIDYGTTWSASTPLVGSSSTQRWVAANQSATGIAFSPQTIGIIYYHQFLLRFDFSVNGGGSGYSQPTVQFAQAGTTVTAQAGSSVWADSGSNYTFSSALPGSSANEKWASGSPSGTVSSSKVISITFYHQYLLSLSYLVVGGGFTTSPTFYATSLGATLTQSLSSTPQSVWTDAGSKYSVTNPLGGSTSTERWYTYTQVGTATSPGPLVVAYTHQYLITIAGAGVSAQWLAAGPAGNVNVTSVYGRLSGSGFRLTSYSIDGGPSTAIAPTASAIAIPLQVGSPHKLTFSSVNQYQVNIDDGGLQALSAITPPTVQGDNYWYDAGAPVQITLNGVWNRTATTGSRLAAYSINQGRFISAATSMQLAVLSVPSISSPQYISTRVSSQFLLGTPADPLNSVTAPPIKGDTGWYDQGTSVTAVYNYVWGVVANQSRTNAIGYSVDGSNTALQRAGHDTFKVTVRMTKPHSIGISSVAQYRLSISGGPSSLSIKSPTADSFYDSGSSLTATTSYTWNVVTDRSRQSLASYTLDGVGRNITRAETGNFTTPTINFQNPHSLVFNFITQYSISLQFTDSAGAAKILPTNFRVSALGKNQNVMNFKAWFDNGTNLSIGNVLWENADVTPEQASYKVGGPNTFVVHCRVYDAKLRVVDALGLPISRVSVSFTLANGTQTVQNTKDDGLVTIPMIPLGRFNATISYLGITARVAGDASVNTITETRVPLSYSTVGVSMGVVAAVVASFFVLRMRKKAKAGKKAEEAAATATSDSKPPRGGRPRFRFPRLKYLSKRAGAG